MFKESKFVVPHPFIMFTFTIIVKLPYISILKIFKNKISNNIVRQSPNHNKIKILRISKILYNVWFIKFIELAFPRKDVYDHSNFEKIYNLSFITFYE
jgi:predicted metalloenzyme YecM